MRKFLVILFLIVAVLGVSNAQGGHKIKYRADMGYYDEEVLNGAQRLIGNVAFAQDNVRGYCDSAYLYEQDNYIIAFGDKVKILVGDSVRLYGRRAYYDGDEKTASIAVNVRLEKGQAYLLTDSIIYNTKQEVGYYLTGGKLINDKDTMTSQEGLYYTKTDIAIAKKNVLLWNDTYHVDCDSLKYNAASKIAYFISRTHLTSDEHEIFTTSGWYDTEHEISTLAQDVQLFSGSQSMTADSVYYDRALRYGRGWNNATIVDTAKKYVVKGNYVEHHEKEGISLATDSNLLVLIDDNQDSLFLHSDTIMVYFDEEHELQWARAYNKVKFYREDMQGACDSLAVLKEDSTLFMFYNPVIWTESYQLTGDTIRYMALDSVNSQVDLIKAGFVVGSLYDDTEFNQIKGVNITGFLTDQNLYRVDVVGNAECVYYLQEEDSTLIGINTSMTSEMRVLLDSNKIQQIRFYDSPDGKVYPDEQFENKDRKLQDFRWLIDYRPRNIMDLYVKPIPRYKD
ncbi:MAG: hypothetical protein MJZ87_02360 [Bacteroidales bacterium]|nr:hypothetical protein [Bacteroidales bacterium]